MMSIRALGNLDKSSLKKFYVGLLFLEVFFTNSLGFAEMQCFVSENNHWRPCWFICELPQKTITIYKTTEESSKDVLNGQYAAQVIEKTGVVRHYDLGLLECTGGGMSKSDFVFKKGRDFFDSLRDGHLIDPPDFTLGCADESGQPQDPPTCGPPDSLAGKECREPRYEPALASCITKRRAVYVTHQLMRPLKSKPTDQWPLEYHSYDFEHPLTNVSSQYRPFAEAPNTVASGQIQINGDDLLMNFKKGEYTYQLTLGHTKTSPHGKLAVIKGNQLLQEEECLAYSFDSSLQRETFKTFSSVEVNEGIQIMNEAERRHKSLCLSVETDAAAAEVVEWLKKQNAVSDAGYIKGSSIWIHFKHAPNSSIDMHPPGFH